MFQSKSVREGNLTILEIFDGLGTIARFVPERGGILAELFLSGIQVFYLDRETLYDESKNIRGGNPILFPICGPLEEGKYNIGGQTYHMKQHGLARNNPWEVAEIICRDHMALVTLKFLSSEETKLSYPFDFKLEYTYELYSDRIIIRQDYYNGSPTDMPFYSGFHPYFLASGLVIKNLYLPATSCYNIKTSTEQPFKSIPDLNASPETNLVFTDLSDSKAWFERDDGWRIAIEFDVNFPYVVLWALREKDFLCIEPWMGNNYDLNRGRGRVLKSGEELKAQISYIVCRA